MSQDNSLACPIDFVAINENKVRLVAVHVFVTSIILIIQPNWILMSVLALDFLLRTIKFNTFSPFAVSSAGIIKVFSLGFKPVDQGPKRFAAGIGLTFSLALLLAHLTGYPTLALVLIATLTLFSFLEGFLSFCAGCYVYTFLINTFKIFQPRKQ